jgi:adenine-specific DNA-methyltransferase
MPKRRKTNGRKKASVAPPRAAAFKAKSKRGASARERKAAEPASAKPYTHPTHDLATRPEIGTQAQFRKKKAPKTYKCDSSLAPALDWDGQNAAREQGEALIERILKATSLDDARAAAEELARISKPFLNWAGKAERLSFDVPTLPLFVHERLSTKAILETLKAHKKDQQEVFDLFGDPQRSITDQVLRSYEHKDRWVNRMVLGDSLVVMNSLLEYEGLGGQVQMIYIDPPYGVKFGSNFQPFVRKRDVKHNDDGDMTREPETVQAYRDTWELGLHSYLTYLRDRLLVCRDLLTPTGSVFVQISDENLHHVREVMDEVFGAERFVSQIQFLKTSGFETGTVATLGDYLLWYSASNVPYVQKVFEGQPVVLGQGNATWLLLPDGTFRGSTAAERRGDCPPPRDAQLYKPDNIVSQGASREPQPFEFEGKTFSPPAGSHWKANYPDGMRRLARANRLHVAKNSLQYRRFASDFGFAEIGNVWTDTRTGNFTDDKLYVVQTSSKVIERCILMATRPGDLVLDPTCGSGTTAHVAEQWGRRWITIDTSRVPLALARQRLLTSTFQWYDLVDESRGPAGGLVYRRRQNLKGEEIGGIVPHLTLKSIANDEPPKQEVLVDRPEETTAITRVSGPFVVEATIPTPVDFDGDGIDESATNIAVEHGSFVERMLEVLRRSPNLQVAGGKTVTLRNIRPPARSLALSAEAIVDVSAHGQQPSLIDVIDEAEERRGDRLALSGKPVAIVFGPENGAVSEKLVFNAAKEANARNYSHLYVIGFAIQPNAREMVESAEAGLGIPATYVQMTPDLMMGDLLKNLRSSQIFSVCGLPDVEIAKVKKKDKTDPDRYAVRLLGLDTFDPATNEVVSIEGNDVPCWLLDTDYNDLCFHVSQAFFPRTGAWENLRKALRADYEESVWDHLNGGESAPFEAGRDTKIAVKVIDARGNELMVVKKISEAVAR